MRSLPPRTPTEETSEIYRNHLFLIIIHLIDGRDILIQILPKYREGEDLSELTILF